MNHNVIQINCDDGGINLFLLLPLLDCSSLHVELNSLRNVSIFSTGNPGNFEKNPRSKAKTNNKLNPHMYH